MKGKYLFGAMALVGIVFTSCEKELESTPLLRDMSQTATVRVYLKADLDLSTKGDESVPQGTSVVFSVPNSDYEYAGDGTSTKGAWTTKATVNADGYAEVSVPTDANGVTLTISPANFEYNQVQPVGSPASTIKNYFSIASSTLTVSIAESKIATYTYSSGVSVNENDPYTATISGIVYAELNNTLSGNEKASGVSVEIYSSSWTQIVTTNLNGEYSVTVPVDVNGESYTVKAHTFTYNQIQPLQSNTASTIKMQYDAVTASANTVMANENRSVNLTYVAPTNVDATPAVNYIPISGKLQADLDEETVPLENFATNTKFIFHTSKWSKEVSISNTGTYTVSVPENEAVYFSCDFEVSRRVWDGGVGAYVTKKYRCNVSSQAVGAYDYENGLVDLSISSAKFSLINPVN